ncbi:hypothetical protein HDV06_001895 [Boothiomyces sp. JEL0866]|nr:hypothetical protein HDV06_001895 [Boothiomyces sp. JEL0866]
MSMTYEDESIISQRRSSLMSGRSSSYSTRSIEDAFTVEALMEEVKVWKNLYFETMLKLKNEQNRLELDSQDYVTSCWLQAEVGIKNVDNAVNTFDDQQNMICSWLQAEIGISNALKAALEGIEIVKSAVSEQSIIEKQREVQPVARTRSDSSITVFNDTDECFQHDLNTTWYQASHAIQQKELVDHSAKYNQEYLVSSWLQGTVGISNANYNETAKKLNQKDLELTWIQSCISIESFKSSELSTKVRQQDISNAWLQASNGIICSESDKDYIYSKNQEIKADWIQASAAIQAAESLSLEIKVQQQYMISTWIQASSAIQNAEFAAQRQQYDQEYIMQAYNLAESGIKNAEQDDDTLFMSIDYQRIQEKALESLQSNDALSKVQGEELSFEYACYQTLVNLLHWKFNPTAEPLVVSLVISKESVLAFNKEVDTREISGDVLPSQEMINKDSQDYLIAAWLQASLAISSEAERTLQQNHNQSEMMNAWLQASSLIKQAEFAQIEQQYSQEYLVLSYNQAETAIVNAYDYNNEDETLDLSIDFQELKAKAVQNLKQKIASRDRVFTSNSLENICYEVLVGILQWKYQEDETPLKMTILLDGSESTLLDPQMDIEDSREINMALNKTQVEAQEYLVSTWLQASLGIRNVELNATLIERQQEYLVGSWLQASAGIISNEYAEKTVQYQQEYLALCYNQAGLGITNSQEWNTEEELHHIKIDFETVREKALDLLRQKQSTSLDGAEKQDSLENVCLEILVQVLQWKFNPSPSTLKMTMIIDGQNATLGEFSEVIEEVADYSLDQMYLAQSWMMAEIAILKAEQMENTEPSIPTAREIVREVPVIQTTQPIAVEGNSIVLEKKLKDLSQKAKAERRTRRALVDLLISRVRELEDDHDFDYE